MGTEKMVVVVEVETTSEPAHMNAKEARAIADKKLRAIGKSIFETIIEKIPKYASEGKLKHDFRIEGQFSITSEQTAVVLLEQLGYKVKIVRTGSSIVNWYEVQW